MACKTQNYKLVDTEASLKESLSELRSCESNAFLAVDCEGVNLSRKGELTIITVATEEKAYIFDVTVLKQAVFDEGLREILEDKSREKLMFDCREDADSLWHQFQVKLTGVLDVQLLEIMYRRESSASGAQSTGNRRFQRRRSQREHEVENIYGFRRCIELYIEDENVLKTKDEVKELLKWNDKLWKRRPLPGTLLRYCAVDTLEMFKLYEKLKSAKDKELPRLRIASERYANMLRSKAERRFDGFEKNAYLPLDIIPEKGTLDFPHATTQCTKCQRLFPDEEFSKIQLRNGEQKCRVCKEIKRYADLKAERQSLYDAGGVSDWQYDENYY
uniref:PiRNA biogenesis protein EXD1-like n=1 Tax=Actinia tenebrosa TaxID=6105 RepID=A0A6P8J2G2_ACTTE